MITIKVPGKLMLTGEWSILEPGNHCIVMAIDKYLTTTCERKGFVDFQFSLPNLQLPLITATYSQGNLTIISQLTPEQEKKFSMVYHATELALEYLNKSPYNKNTKINGPISLTITSEISNISNQNGTQLKLGFGSSSACIVGTIKALFAHAGHDITTQETLDHIFKLSVIAHYIAQGNSGSGFDIAAATYETTLIYESFNAQNLFRELTSIESIKSHLIPLITQPWPRLKITPIKLPQNSIVLVGFSGSSANTKELITAMNTYKKRDKETYMHIISSINTLVREVEATLLEKEPSPAKKLFDIINKNRMLLSTLAQKSGITLETPELTKLISLAQKWGAGAKFSGAGGGDCGIALCSDISTAEKIKQTWLKNNIIPIDVKIL